MPFDFKATVGWAKSHPWEAGGLVFIVGVAAFFLLGRQGGSSSDGGAQASLGQYLAAQTAQNQSDNATTAYLAKLKGDTEVATIVGKTQTDIANTWATNTAAANANDNETALKGGIIEYFGKLANNLGTVLTSSSAYQKAGGGGFSLGFGGFSIGGSSNKSSGSASSSQTLVKNDLQEFAATSLRDIADALFIPGN